MSSFPSLHVMIFRREYLPFILLLIATPLVSAQSPDVRPPSDARIWTSRAGSTFTGTLASAEGDVVVLIGTNGREVRLRRDQLSIEDRQYLQDTERARHAALIEHYRAGDFSSANLPEKALIRDVPHVSQLPNFCVPASTEMLLRFYGFDYDQEYLARLSSRDAYRGGGTNYSHMSQGLKNLGIDSVMLQRHSPTPERTALENLMNGIRSNLAEGRPVIISYDNLGNGHAVLAVGYDDRRHAFTVMDPAIGDQPERLDYRAIEDHLRGALVVLPASRRAAQTAASSQPPPRAFLSRISKLIQTANPADLHGFARRLAEEESIQAEFRNANRIDLRSSQGQTYSFARSQGVDVIQMALARGLVLVASQNYEEGPGTILIYGVNDDHFEAVEYHPSGAMEKRSVPFNDFSLRWPRESDRTYALPLIEIPVPVS